MSHNPVNWFEIYVSDMARARRFYETVLAIEMSKAPAMGDDMEMWFFPSNMEQGGPGASGSLIYYPGYPVGGNSTIVYFSCMDCAVEAGRVVAAGGKIEKPKFSIGEYGFIALVVDTEGNMIGLYSMQ
jgi:predicted enzyme related to lactoylglutathione lyase